MSRAIVQPMEVEELPVGLQPAVRMVDVPGKPGTRLGLVFRSIQFVLAVITLALVGSTDFTSSPTYSFVVAAAGLMCLWSFSLAILDLHALLVGRRLQKPPLGLFFTVGDAIAGALLFTAANMSAGLSRFMCDSSDCSRITASTVFAYLCIAALSLSFFLNFSSLP